MSMKFLHFIVLPILTAKEVQVEKLTEEEMEALKLNVQHRALTNARGYIVSDQT